MPPISANGPLPSLGALRPDVRKSVVSGLEANITVRAAFDPLRALVMFRSVCQSPKRRRVSSRGSCFRHPPRTAGACADTQSDGVSSASSFGTSGDAVF